MNESIKNPNKSLLDRIKDDNVKKEEHITSVTDKVQLLLAAPDNYAQTRKELGWDEESKEAMKTLGSIVAEKNTRETYKDLLVYSEVDLMKFLIKYDYDIIRASDYKYKTPQELLGIIDDYYRKNNGVFLDQFYILYPRHIDMPDNKSEVIKNRNTPKSEELIVIYHTPESRHSDENFYVVLNSTGKGQSGFNYLKYLIKPKYYTQFQESVFNGILLMLTFMYVLFGIVNHDGIITNNYINLFHATLVLLIPVFLPYILYIPHYSNADKFYLKYDKEVNSWLRITMSEFCKKYRSHLVELKSSIRTMLIRDLFIWTTKTLSTIALLIILYIGINETRYYFKSTVPDKYVIIDTDKEYEPSGAYTNVITAKYNFTLVKRVGFMHYETKTISLNSNFTY